VFWVKSNRDPTNAIVVEKTNKSWEIRMTWDGTFPFLNKKLLIWNVDSSRKTEMKLIWRI
jgi:hypothetical protein